jgi:hypothetical protein
VPVGGLSLLSPITTPCRVVAQAVNYRSHARESGFGEEPPANAPTDDSSSTQSSHQRQQGDRDELRTDLVGCW